LVLFDAILSLLRSNTVNSVRKSRFAIVLTVIVWLIGAADLRAQSRDDSQKRLFAARLTRTARIAATQAPRSANTRGESRNVESSPRKRSATDATRSAPSHHAHAARATPVVTGPTLGISPATVVTPSGYGSGRDAYVEALYPQILGRVATQSDVDYWARLLASGVHADIVAEDIWNSQEHKTLVRNGDAPGIPLQTAYLHAYAIGLANCKYLLRWESRHPGKRYPY
jgi:hypothetical protein